MRAAQVIALNGPASLVVKDIPDAEAAAREVLIDVAYAGITYPDVLMSRGLYQERAVLPYTLGLELSGIVRFAPEGSALSSGDRVAASTRGACQEVVAVAPDRVFCLPDTVGLELAAGIPTNYLTAEFALNLRGRLRPGEWVLVHGAAGGVGTAAIQMAKVIGATVVAVTSTSEKADTAKASGADHTVPADEFLVAVRELTDGRGVDVVVDPVGGGRFADSLRALAPLGRLMVIGFTGGEIPSVKVNRLLLNNIEVIGVAWGSFAGTHAGFARQQWSRLVPHLASGALRPQVSHVYELRDVAVALAALEERTATGKLLIKLN